jgi:hypothetical protein
MSDPLKLLSDEGVAVWLDDMSRERLVSGNLKALVRDKHVVGVTTNPTIFHKAITSSHVYDEQIANLAALDIPVAEAIRLLTTHDVRAVCDSRVSQFLLITFRLPPRLRERLGFLAGWPAQGMGREIWRR